MSCRYEQKRSWVEVRSYTAMARLRSAVPRLVRGLSGGEGAEERVPTCNARPEGDPNVGRLRGIATPVGPFRQSTNPCGPLPPATVLQALGGCPGRSSQP